MKHKFTKIILLTAVVAGFTAACNPASENIPTGKRYEFNNILDIAYTPDTLTRCRGWFTDAGSWMGFTLPQKDHWVNGFCGPFSLDMNRRKVSLIQFLSMAYFTKKPTPITNIRIPIFPKRQKGESDRARNSHPVWPCKRLCALLRGWVEPQPLQGF